MDFSVVVEIFSSLIRRCLGQSSVSAFIHCIGWGVCITYRAGKDFRLLLGLEAISVCVYLFLSWNTSACADIFGVLRCVAIRCGAREYIFGQYLKSRFGVPLLRLL